jgi:hypothetical protein
MMEWPWHFRAVRLRRAQAAPAATPEGAIPPGDPRSDPSSPADVTRQINVSGVHRVALHLVATTMPHGRHHGCSRVKDSRRPVLANAGRSDSSGLRERQPLLLNQVHNRHDSGRLRQLNTKLLHDRSEVLQEVVERLLAFPHIEDLKLPIFTET